MSNKLTVYEMFESIQGESSFAGKTCFFVRLTGCNLRCRYCDTIAAYYGGTDLTVDQIVKKAIASKAEIIEITGGEPLMQKAFPELAKALLGKCSRPVLVETNGSLDISVIPAKAIAIMDIKCPSSCESASNDLENIVRLRKHDEVKFVLSDGYDYEWALDLIKTTELQLRCKYIHLSPADGQLDPDELADWIKRDKPPARLHLQLHKIMKVK